MDVSSMSRMASLPVCISRLLPILGSQMDRFKASNANSPFHTSISSHYGILDGGLLVSLPSPVGKSHRFFVPSSGLVILEIHEPRNHGNAGNAMFSEPPGTGCT
mgnify:CR=1 FL=1